MHADLFDLDNQFQSTLPAWGATKQEYINNAPLSISIHAPRMGSDCAGRTIGLSYSYFNPRSPHGERQL